MAGVAPELVKHISTQSPEVFQVQPGGALQLSPSQQPETEIIPLCHQRTIQ